MPDSSKEREPGSISANVSDSSDFKEVNLEEAPVSRHVAAGETAPESNGTNLPEEKDRSQDGAIPAEGMAESAVVPETEAVNAAEPETAVRGQAAVSCSGDDASSGDGIPGETAKEDPSPEGQPAVFEDNGTGGRSAEEASDRVQPDASVGKLPEIPGDIVSTPDGDHGTNVPAPDQGSEESSCAGESGDAVEAGDAASDADDEDDGAAANDGNDEDDGAAANDGDDEDSEDDEDDNDVPGPDTEEIASVQVGTAPSSTPGVDLTDPALYINRELSQIAFNRRVLEQAFSPTFPLLDQLNFLSIFHNNLDEFFMVRVPGIQQQCNSGMGASTADGLAPSRLLAEIRRQVVKDLNTAHERWRKIRALLSDQGVRIKKCSQLTKFQKNYLDKYFMSEIYPVLTPQIVDPTHPFPTISNLSINFLVKMRCPGKEIRFVRLRCPTNVSRFIFVPRSKQAVKTAELGLSGTLRDTDIILLEDLLRLYLDKLFVGNKILDFATFRITRNTDMELAEEEADDLLEAVRDMVDQRRFGDVVRLEVSRRMNAELLAFLTRHLKLKPHQVYKIRGPLAFNQMSGLTALDRPCLKLPSYHPRLPEFCRGDIFDNIRKKDRLVYLPYESFESVLEFVRQACADPQVVAIKQTLYRVGGNSPIVAELMKARRMGKQVTAVVELKARFDEERNINWAEDLENAGVNVVYGLRGMKIHAKLCLVVRREERTLRCYAHIGTGNYNPVTARIYTDMGLFTADAAICGDITNLFNTMTGYAVHEKFDRLLVSPMTMRSGLVERIRREIDHQKRTGNGHIVFKCNHLADDGMVRELYAASMAGVRIDLQVRGICCLRPGIPGISENIRVTSIVGRFLEHPRLYWFANNGDDELFMGSSDLMQRNLNRRIEVVTPVLDTGIRHYLKESVLDLHLADNVQAQVLSPEGTYAVEKPGPDEKMLSSQNVLLERYGKSSRGCK